jgi:hypothetical protein
MASLGSDRRMSVHFVHPTDSAQVLTVAVSRNATPRFVISQLIQHKFIVDVGAGGGYKLVDTTTKTELRDDEPLEKAGVADGTTLQVTPRLTAASPGRIWP